uniref:Uncharacterized protein TCIL3000_11_2960 n=1 Tax=Trypanosoma congolense (strain IL3000) TaxID=1068625 RepID=G0UZT3_TRYCI|nr:unnamed protein product [Trypanosoma congolense IL3000]
MCNLYFGRCVCGGEIHSTATQLKAVISQCSAHMFTFTKSPRSLPPRAFPRRPLVSRAKGNISTSCNLEWKRSAKVFTGAWGRKVTHLGVAEKVLVEHLKQVVLWPPKGRNIQQVVLLLQLMPTLKHAIRRREVCTTRKFSGLPLPSFFSIPDITTTAS